MSRQAKFGPRVDTCPLYSNNIRESYANKFSKLEYGNINRLFCQYLFGCLLCFNRLLQRNDKSRLKEEICDNNIFPVLADIYVWTFNRKFTNILIHITSKQERPDPLI